MVELIVCSLIIGWGIYAYRRETGWDGLKEFETDDCSGGMSWAYGKLTGKRVPWADACVEHDRAYHKGGTAVERKQADVWLMMQVAEIGYPWWAVLMFVAVRLGGVWWLPTAYRWGYCWAFRFPWRGLPWKF